MSAVIFSIHIPCRTSNSFVNNIGRRECVQLPAVYLLTHHQFPRKIRVSVSDEVSSLLSVNQEPTHLRC